MQNYPKKLYYRIGEVCSIVGVEPHVLRYWESEFARLSPPKNKAGQRTYRPKDIEMLLEIRKLLYDEGFTIAGARRKLAEGASGGAPDSATETPDSGSRGVGAAGAPPQRERPTAEKPTQRSLSQVRRELENILTLLDRG